MPTNINMQKGIKTSLVGIVIETIGLVADIIHHLDIGIETEEGLITAQHGIIFAGFLVSAIGILMIWSSYRNTRG